MAMKLTDQKESASSQARLGTGSEVFEEPAVQSRNETGSVGCENHVHHHG